MPALNFISVEFNIPDDVAGATLMAAGASSPELLSSAVSLFVTHSSLGLGTVVGSEIFNQLIICAGAVFSCKLIYSNAYYFAKKYFNPSMYSDNFPARSGQLQLDRIVVIREVFFYTLSVALLYVALQDKRPVPDDTVDHIYISFVDGALLCAGYVIYIIVLINTKAISRWCFQTRTPLTDSKADYGSIKSEQSKVRLFTVMGLIHDLSANSFTCCLSCEAD